MLPECLKAAYDKRLIQQMVLRMLPDIQGDLLVCDIRNFGMHVFINTINVLCQMSQKARNHQAKVHSSRLGQKGYRLSHNQHLGSTKPISMKKKALLERRSRITKKYLDDQMNQWEGW